ncbi:MAG: AGE family epimerase/isomerase [Bacteroidaceae bacterium]|nr:AGE family epimerase/isomerase [Bacteroidaceae bacterium]
MEDKFKVFKPKGAMQFEFSDLISGYVQSFDEKNHCFELLTTDKRNFKIVLTDTTFARMLRNLDEPYQDCTGDLYSILSQKGRMVFAYGLFYPKADNNYEFEAKQLDFPERTVGKYRFEESNWWSNQAKSICDFFVKAQFGTSGDIDYKHYRTSVNLSGENDQNTYRQETDTISRMIYGMASAFMLTGEDKFLDVAEKGVEYLSQHMRFYDVDENIVYWYHGIDVKNGKETKIFTSEFGDDYDAIPMYEQIYALAGPIQTYRINGDPGILRDTELTISLFERFFKDKKSEGYYSHIDPVLLSPASDSLGANKLCKNWNSVGDHAPAYLINLYLATGEEKYRKFLEYTADAIVTHFPDYEHSPFVNERFHDNWSFDQSWGWQQDRAVVGHNLKIAWNLMRINSVCPKKIYEELAHHIANVMPKVGLDVQRGGWYDVIERKLHGDQEYYRFAWHDRKAWWQQEQAILAYEILYGIYGKEEYLRYARESAAFYNTFFLDHEDGAVYFNVLNNGLPYLLGTERNKGSHSMSAYHSVELAYLAATYTNLLNTKKSLPLYFKPMVNGFKDNLLRVQPDILPAGSIKIAHVWIDGKEWTRYDAEKMIIELPALNYRPKIKVIIEPK